LLQALKHLMHVMKANSEETEAIMLAIDVVGVASDDHLANQLIEFLLGETDGIPRVSVEQKCILEKILVLSQSLSSNSVLWRKKYFKIKILLLHLKEILAIFNLLHFVRKMKFVKLSCACVYVYLTNNFSNN